MIICPACKEEIDDDSHYCDQCGQALLFCNQCGRVGIGRRCTYCGGLMVAKGAAVEQASAPSFGTFGTFGSIKNVSQAPGVGSMPVLTLANDSLNIRLVAMNGAIIGRRKGPYTRFFENQAYVSGVHAQLKYNPGSGWCIADKHSSNGTKLNQHVLQPDVEMTLNNGDILTLANISLQVIIR
jgi:hypothetical protein